MAMADVPSKPKPRTFGEAFRNLRIQRALSYADAADLVGRNKNWIKNLEKNKVLPRGQEKPRLFAAFPQLRAYIKMLPTASDFEDELPARNEPEPDLTLPEVPKEFHLALEYFRIEAGLDRDELSDLCGVSSGAIWHWENASAVPIKSHYEILLDLFPGLKLVSHPLSRDIPKPAGRRLDKGDREPAKVMPLFSENDYRSEGSEKPEEKEDQNQEEASDVVKAGAMHAEALVRLERAKTKKKAAQKLLAEANSDIDDAEQEVKDAMEALQKAVTSEALKEQ